MCNQVCNTVRENALTMNVSLIFKSKRQYIVHLFFSIFSLTIKEKTKMSLTIKILHLGQSSFTGKVRTIFDKVIDSCPNFRYMDTSSTFAWLFTNEHEQVYKKQVALLKNVFCCEDTTDPIDIIRLGELLQLFYMLY